MGKLLICHLKILVSFLLFLKMCNYQGLLLIYWSELKVFLLELFNLSQLHHYIIHIIITYSVTSFVILLIHHLNWEIISDYQFCSDFNSLNPIKVDVEKQARQAVLKTPTEKITFYWSFLELLWWVKWSLKHLSFAMDLWYFYG